MAKAQQRLDLAAQPTATDTVTIGESVYTFEADASGAAGDVAIGADAEESLDNLIAAINLDPAGAGTAYHVDTVRNPYVSAVKVSATEMDAVARLDGIEGNQIGVSETGLEVGDDWDAATLAGGTGSASKQIEDIVDFEQVNSSVFSRIRALKSAE